MHCAVDSWPAIVPAKLIEGGLDLTGFIGMSCREIARFSAVYESLMNLQKPPGTGFVQCRSMHGPENWNLMGKMLLDDPNCEWIFCTEDDHIYRPDTLLKLLSHGKDIVSGLYLKKDQPYEPIVYDEVGDGTGNLYPHFLDDAETGLVEADVVGVGCLLIRRKVFETIPAPWWVLTAPPAPPDKINSDVEWCRTVKRAGFQIWCDLDVPVAHISVVPVVPVYRGGKWSTLLVTSEKAGLSVPPDRNYAAVEEKKIQLVGG